MDHAKCLLFHLVLHDEKAKEVQISLNFITLNRLHIPICQVGQVFVGECNDTVALLCILSQDRLEVFGDRGAVAQFEDLLRRALNERLICLIKVILADDTHSL